MQYKYYFYIVIIFLFIAGLVIISDDRSLNDDKYKKDGDILLGLSIPILMLIFVYETYIYYNEMLLKKAEKNIYINYDIDYGFEVE